MKRKRSPGETEPSPVAKAHKSLHRVTAASADIKDLPHEVVDNVIMSLALAGDDREVARSLAAVELVNRGLQNALCGSPAEEYRQSLAAAGKAARRNYTLLRVKASDGKTVSGGEYADTLGAGLHLLSPAEQSIVVDEVLAIPTALDRARALSKVAPSIRGLSDHNHARVFDKACELIEQPADGGMFHACKALAKMHEHLWPDEKARVRAIENKNPAAAATIAGELSALHETETTSTAENTPSPGGGGVITAEERLRSAAEDLQAKVEGATRARRCLVDKLAERSGRA